MVNIFTFLEMHLLQSWELNKKIDNTLMHLLSMKLDTLV